MLKYEIGNDLHHFGKFLLFFELGPKSDLEKSGAFHLSTSVYLLGTLIPSFAHDSAYQNLQTFFTLH